MKDETTAYLLCFYRGLEFVNEFYEDLESLLKRMHDLEYKGYDVDLYLCRKVW